MHSRLQCMYIWLLKRITIQDFLLYCVGPVVVTDKVTRLAQLICPCPHDVTRPVILPSSPSAGAPSGACAKPQLFVRNILLIKPG